MSEPSLSDLDKGQAVIVERLAHMERDVDFKHNQNRNSIHAINDQLQKLTNEVWMIKVKIVGYASGAGVLTGILIKLVDHLWKT